MGTPHNEAEKGEIAKRVLMPGDPLRAKYIAEHFLKDAVCFNTVRNMLGYTGTYKGEKISHSRSEEHTSELQARGLISYAVFCLKKKKKQYNIQLY